jgi:hypothetical protein
MNTASMMKRRKDAGAEPSAGKDIKAGGRWTTTTALERGSVAFGG